MYARIGRFEVVEGKEKELADGYKTAVDILRTQKGYRDAILLIDPKTGHALSVTLWDSLDNLDTPAAAAVVNKMLPLVSPFQKTKPEFTTCKVVVKDQLT